MQAFRVRRVVATQAVLSLMIAGCGVIDAEPDAQDDAGAVIEIPSDPSECADGVSPAAVLPQVPRPCDAGRGDGGGVPSDPDLVDAGAAQPDAATETEPPPGSVYADVLAPGWSLNGWGWSSSAQETATTARGVRAIAVQMNRGWSGFVLARVQAGAPHHFEAGSHQAVSFWIHAGAAPERVAALELRLNNGNANVRLRDWLQGPLRANEWAEVSIPFEALNPSGASYHRIEWFNASDSTFDFTLDDVTLTPAAPPVSRPSSVAVARTVSTGQSADRMSWLDADGRARSADFVDDTYRGGYIRAMRYETAAGVVREAHGGVDPSTGYQGFGYLVSHYDTGSNNGTASADSRDGDYSPTLKNNGHSSLAWQGKHHAIREYTVDLHPGLYRAAGRGTVHATVHWLVASGRSSIVFSVTFDSSANAPDAIVADSRAPYGALAWDGRGGSETISGVSWGDKRRFVADAGAGKLGVGTGWSYTASNTVPFVSVWTAGSDAEMGLVETRSWAQGVSAGDLGVWFDAQGRVRGSQRMDQRCWNRTSETATNCADPASDGANAKMPVTWAWPYQSVNYGLGQATTNKKIAWGTNYGAIGSRSVVSFGERVYSGYPYTSYTTQVVLGTHSEGSVMGTVAAQEAALSTRVTAQVGTVRDRGPGGVGRSDQTAYDVPGFDPVYGAFALAADSAGRSDFTLESGTATLVHPLVVVDGALGEPNAVKLDGATLTDGVDYYASVQGTRIWLTLNRDLTGTHTLSVR